MCETTSVTRRFLQPLLQRFSRIPDRAVNFNRITSRFQVPERVLEYFSKAPDELVSILTRDLEKSKQANLAKNPLAGTAGRAIIKALFRTIF